MSGKRAAAGRMAGSPERGDLDSRPGRGREIQPTFVAAGETGFGVPAGLVIDFDQREALLDGREIGLLFQEFQLLEFLTTHPYRAFTRDQLLSSAWPDRQPGTGRTVDVHVHRLRRKLGPGYARYLITVRRVGYMFRPPQLSVSSAFAVTQPGP